MPHASVSWPLTIQHHVVIVSAQCDPKFTFHLYSQVQETALMQTLHLSPLTDTLVYWAVTPCGLVGTYRLFRGTYCLCLQSWSIREGAFGKRHLGRPWKGWDDNISMIREGCGVRMEGRVGWLRITFSDGVERLDSPARGLVSWLVLFKLASRWSLFAQYC
jgi:hypothetical protein